MVTVFAVTGTVWPGLTRTQPMENPSVKVTSALVIAPTCTTVEFMTVSNTIVNGWFGLVESIARGLPIPAQTLCFKVRVIFCESHWTHYIHLLSFRAPKNLLHHQPQYNWGCVQVKTCESSVGLGLHCGDIQEVSFEMVPLSSFPWLTEYEPLAFSAFFVS